MVSLAEQGKKHQPLVEVKEDKIIINIWRDIPHPMEEAHLIDSVDILQITPAGLIRVKHFDLSAGQEPKIEINKDELKPWTYKIQARCNLHGTWDDVITL